MRSLLSLTVRKDSGLDGPSDVCEEKCQDEATALKIEFYEGKTQAEKLITSAKRIIRRLW